jgi:hypothetical protein
MNFEPKKQDQGGLHAEILRVFWMAAHNGEIGGNSNVSLQICGRRRRSLTRSDAPDAKRHNLSLP